jgi:hypothetical protein
MTTKTPGYPTDWEASHGLLLAVLAAAGGSVDLPQSAFDPDRMGPPDGSFHAVEIDPQSNGTVRLRIVPRPTSST